MTQKSILNHSRALEGVHGVQVTPHSPFDLTETTQSEDFHTSTGRASTTEANQQLLMQ